MQATEEKADVISLKELCERVRHILFESSVSGQSSVIEKLDKVVSYVDLLEIVDQAIRLYASDLWDSSRRDELVTLRPLVLNQLARIEREHEATTSLEALCDDVLGIIEGWPTYNNGRIGLVATYEDLDEFVTRGVGYMYAEYPETVKRLLRVQMIIRSKVAQ